MKTVVVTVVALLASSQVFADHLDCKETSTEPKGTAEQLGVSAYDPLYFILGANGGFNAKFQISFKYQVFSECGLFAKRLSGLSNIYLSYTQTSLWDLHDRSSPFKDSSYKPRIFYAREDFWRAIGPSWHVSYEAGFAHESNGKADLDSRSINLAYVKPTLSYTFGKNGRVYVSPMVVSYVDKGENPDINDYRGHVDLLIGYGNGNDVKNGAHGWNAWTILRKGDKGHYGSVEANLAAPLKPFNGWLLAQYFSGWGETMVDYNQKLNSQFRLGFAILVQ